MKTEKCEFCKQKVLRGYKDGVVGIFDKFNGICQTHTCNFLYTDISDASQLKKLSKYSEGLQFE